MVYTDDGAVRYNLDSGTVFSINNDLQGQVDFLKAEIEDIKSLLNQSVKK